MGPAEANVVVSVRRRAGTFASSLVSCVVMTGSSVGEVDGGRVHNSQRLMIARTVAAAGERGTCFQRSQDDGGRLVFTTGGSYCYAP